MLGGQDKEYLARRVPTTRKKLAWTCKLVKYRFSLFLTTHFLILLSCTIIIGSPCDSGFMWMMKCSRKKCTHSLIKHVQIGGSIVLSCHQRGLEISQGLFVRVQKLACAYRSNVMSMLCDWQCTRFWTWEALAPSLLVVLVAQDSCQWWISLKGVSWGLLNYSK